MRLPTRCFLYIVTLSLRFRTNRPKPKRVAIQIPRRVALLIDSYQLRVLRYPERYAKTDALGVEAPNAIKLENL
jgi:hypothetical protein